MKREARNEDEGEDSHENDEEYENISVDESSLSQQMEVDLVPVD